MKNLAAVSLVLALLWAGASAAAPANTTNDMAWLDGFTLVELETTDIPSMHTARAMIQSHGGRVAIMSPPSLILGWIPFEHRAELIGVAGIKEIYYTEVLGGEVATPDFQSRSTVNFFNAVCRGDIQRKHFEEAASTAPEDRKPIPNDALPQPEIDMDAYLENLRAVGLDVGRLKDQGLLVSQSPGATMGNSDAMTGTISVTLFLVESDGSIDTNTYTWTTQHQQDFVNGVNTGLAWWTAQAYNHFDCWNAFLVHYYPGTDSRCQQGYEPILNNGTGTAPNANTWVNLVIGKFGYNSPNVFTNVTSFNTWQRSTYGTDWAYSGFVGYNPPPAATQFINGGSAWAYLGGPFTVCLFRSYSWDPSQVFPHESGHIFWACDEYIPDGCEGNGCWCSTSHSTDPNDNCDECPAPHTACIMKANSYALCAYTPAQIGWDGNGCAPAPLAAPVATSVSANNDYQGVTTTITVSGSNFVWGAFVEMGSDVTVNSTTFINSTSFQANITISNTAAPGFRNVVVKNRDLQSSTITNGFLIKESTKHYASPSGGNVYPYITPANAATTLLSAIGAASAGDSLLVVSTTYTNVDFTISQGVKLYGAYDASFASRNLASGKTVLQLSGNVEIGPGAAGASAIDGFEIYGGVGTPQASPVAGRYGGAIWANTSDLTVANCLIRNSQAHDGTFGAGGAICASGGTVVLFNNEIRDCAAAQGGAVSLDACAATLTGNNIHDNDLLYSAQPAYGGGVLAKSCSSLGFSGNTIQSNAADPPMSSNMKGGGIYIGSTAGATMTGDIVASNEAAMGGSIGWGGAICLEGSGLTMTGVTLQGNQSKMIGGGISADATSSVTMTDGKVLSNTATLGGGAYLAGPTTHLKHNLWTGNSGTAFYVINATGGSVVGNTMNLNTGGAMNLSNANVTVKNNIVAGTTGTGIQCGGAAIPTPTYCDVWGNTTNYGGCAAGTGCISLDPLYVNAAGGDYHLALHSPAIDAGDPDPASNDPDGSRGDMGMYGAHAFTMDQPVYPKNLHCAISAGDAVLTWDANPEGDLASYAVYKSADPAFIPSAANFVTLVTAPTTMYNDGAVVSGTFYRLSAVDGSGYASGYAGPVEPDASGIGDAWYAFRLHQNHPNPFNPTTRIGYEVASRVRVTLGVYDVRGALVKTLVDEDRGPGSYTAEWNGTDFAGERVSTGVYFYRLNAGQFAQTRKMVLLK
jgi:hypothetical protein